MSLIQLSHVIRADAADLISANRANQDYHLPWVTSFTDQAGFDTWFARSLTGPNVGLVAREPAFGQIVGVVKVNEIVAGAFQSAYLGYYGISNFSRKGLMTEALRSRHRLCRQRPRIASTGSEHSARKPSVDCLGAPAGISEGRVFATLSSH